MPAIVHVVCRRPDVSEPKLEDPVDIRGAAVRRPDQNVAFAIGIRCPCEFVVSWLIRADNDKSRRREGGTEPKHDR